MQTKKNSRAIIREITIKIGEINEKRNDFYFFENKTTIIMIKKPQKMDTFWKSPISPILFLFLNSPLIKKCSKPKLKFWNKKLVDDVHLLAYGKFTQKILRNFETNIRNLFPVGGHLQNKIRVQKYELVYFTRNPKNRYGNNGGFGIHDHRFFNEY